MTYREFVSKLTVIDELYDSGKLCKTDYEQAVNILCDRFEGLR